MNVLIPPEFDGLSSSSIYYSYTSRDGSCGVAAVAKQATKYQHNVQQQIYTSVP